jgi:hypothetical protein
MIFMVLGIAGSLTQLTLRAVTLLGLLGFVQSCGTESGSDERRTFFGSDSQGTSGGNGTPSTGNVPPVLPTDKPKLQVAKTDWSGDENLGSEIYFVATID